MFIRFKFARGNKVNKNIINELESTLSDRVEFTKLYLKSDGDIEQIYSYSEVDDPNSPKLKELDKDGNPKYKLVILSDQVELDSNKEYLADFELFIAKHPSIKITDIHGLPKTLDKDYTSIIEQMIAVQKKFEDALKMFDSHVEFNQKCDVHISNMALMSVNEVALIEDGCTDKLQGALNNGWRIIAACPQPDSRRPDYILGRYNPEVSERSSCVKL